MKYDIKLRDEQYTVFDIDSSRTIHALQNDYATRDPFEMLKDPKVVVDIGANVGIWSLWVAKHFPDCHVYAIEPHPVNLIHLQAAVIHNRLRNVTVLPCAASHKAELFNLWMDLSNSGATGRYNDHYLGMTPAMVTALPLNTLFDDAICGQVSHMKVDVEGGEFTLFDGFRAWSRIESMEIELHAFPLFKDKAQAVSEVAQLREHVTRSMQGRPLALIGTVNDEQYD